MRVRSEIALRLFLFLGMLFFAVSPARTSEGVVSSMGNVRAVMQARGYYLSTAPEFSGYTPFGDHAPITAIEIIRPNGEPVSIGRLHTSCTCVRLEASKRTFARGERAILNLRNVLPTPPQGHDYAVYVQITRPIRTTLRYDIFLQSAQFIPQPIILAADAGMTDAADENVETIGSVAEDEEEKTEEPVEKIPGEEDTEEKTETAAEPATEPVEEPGENAEESPVRPEIDGHLDTVAEPATDPAEEPGENAEENPVRPEIED